MSREIFLIVGTGATLTRQVIDILDHPGMTAPLVIGPPPMTIELKPEKLTFDLDIKMPREPKKRDWEQRRRKQRRRS